MEGNDPVKLWTPTEAVAGAANITRFCSWLATEQGLAFQSYEQLWRWSVEESERFWKLLLSWFNVAYDGNPDVVTNGKPMPDTRWFENLSLSYAEHVFRNADANAREVAVIAVHENGQRLEISWSELHARVAACQEHFRRNGLTQGDCVVAYLPNGIEATVAFLAANGLGCIWSSCSPDFGVAAVVERFAQIQPKILIATCEYTYGGKIFDTRDTVRAISAALLEVQQIVLVADHEPESSIADSLPVVTFHWGDIMAISGAVLECHRVPFNHPIWVLYSSGTTGKPKAIVHSTGGILLEHLKYGAFHNDFRPGERCFWFTTTGWMMWNYIHGCLLAGCTLVLFDGSPGYPDLMTLWKMADEIGIVHFGVSAAFIVSCLRQHLSPGNTLSFASLRSIGSTGSTLPPEGFQWIYDHVKRDVLLASMSGGTDICSAFVGGNPTLPVYAGEIQCRALGCSLYAFDDEATIVTGQVGEMVITRPMPSMPLGFWHDENHTRYRESYFSVYSNVWRHGDWITVTDRGGVIIYGRSDATLNRAGVRIGTSEVYSAVDKVPEVRDSLIVCIEQKAGTFWMPLFIVMQPPAVLTEDVKSRINQSLKKNFSPRHVPDEIIEVPDIPYTISGKKTETPVKKVLLGADPAKALNRDVLRNPEAMDFFVDLAAARSRR